MTAFAEVQFPPEVSYGSKGGPMFSTDIVSTFSGHEQRNINWLEARARYDTASGIKTEAQWQQLIAFFRSRRGRAVGFRFKDWSDYQGVNILGENRELAALLLAFDPHVDLTTLRSKAPRRLALHYFDHRIVWL